MNKILKKYSANDYFDFFSFEQLSEKCNAPKNNVGVYLVYDDCGNLIYIGCSGWINQDGTLGMRKNGIFARIVNGKQFDLPRKISLSKKMKEQNINKIRVKWYITIDETIKDIPGYVEGLLLQDFFNKQKKLPIWNICF